MDEVRQFSGIMREGTKPQGYAQKAAGIRVLAVFRVQRDTHAVFIDFAPEATGEEICHAKAGKPSAHDSDVGSQGLSLPEAELYTACLFRFRMF